MMKALRDSSIKAKLMWLITGTSFIVLSVATVAWLASSWVFFQANARQNLQALALVTADNVSAALNFGNNDDARTTLSALRATPEVLEAVVYDKTNKSFASYFVGVEKGALSYPETPSATSFANKEFFEVVFPIRFDGENLGNLYMKSSLKQLQAQMVRGIWISALIMVVAIGLSTLLALKLHSLISLPLFDLLSSIVQITEKKAFDVRVQRQGNDEIGRLVDGFNTMIEQLRARDQALAEYQGELEQKVEQRTAELRQANTLVVESEHKIRAIVDTAADPILTFDDGGLIQSFNKAAAVMFGYDAAEIVGKEFRLLTGNQKTSKPNLELTEHLMARALEKPVIGREFVGLGKDGTKFPMELSLTFLETGRGRLFTCILRDISARKAAEAQLIKAKESAEALAKAKSQFLANMSHEIRTPLNGILGTLQLVVKTKLSDDQKELIDMMRTSGDGLLHVVNDILSFSKLDAGKLNLEKISFLPREVFETNLKVFHVRAQQEGLNLSLNVAPTVPQTLIGDPHRLGQVLNNLVGNAVKFTPRGGSISVQLDLKKTDGNEVELLGSVRDSGIGIPKDKQRLIFEAFTQADYSSTRQYGGTGLGLAITNGIIQLMGGRLWVESEPEQGSTFFFTFRLPKGEDSGRPVAPVAASASTVAQAGNATNVTPSQQRILLVEDNVINQKIAQTMLRSNGFEVVTASNGKEALDILSQLNQFDVILMDCQMPIMDGFTAVSHIRESEKKSGVRMPIIAMTAHAMEGDLERCLEAGMDGYVTKPIDEQTLLDHIKQTVIRIRGGSSTKPV